MAKVKVRVSDKAPADLAVNFRPLARAAEIELSERQVRALGKHVTRIDAESPLPAPAPAAASAEAPAPKVANAKTAAKKRSGAK